jgi:heme oxygenase
MENAGVIARLGSETLVYHPDADAELAQLLAAPTAHAYRAWLLRQHGFLAPLEAALVATAHLAEAIDLRPRRKVPLLRSDLLALGMSHSAIADAPVCGAVPRTFTRTSIALGWLYAVERSILQYSNAFRQLARSLPGEVAFASSYLKCYEATLGERWRSFLATVEAACARPTEAGELVVGAQDAFRCLRRWR